MRAKPEDIAAYKAKIADMDDEAFVKEIESKVWFSAFADNNPRAPAHWQVDLCFDEAQRRGKPWLYIRAYNKAYRSCGHEPSESNLLQETEEGFRAHEAKMMEGDAFATL